MNEHTPRPVALPRATTKLQQVNGRPAGSTGAAIELGQEGRRGLVVRVVGPIALRIARHPLQWLEPVIRFFVSFLGGVSGAVFLLWLKEQPGFIRFMATVPLTWQ